MCVSSVSICARNCARPKRARSPPRLDWFKKVGGVIGSNESRGCGWGGRMRWRWGQRDCSRKVSPSVSDCASGPRLRVSLGEVFCADSGALGWSWSCVCVFLVEKSQKQRAWLMWRDCSDAAAFTFGDWNWNMGHRMMMSAGLDVCLPDYHMRHCR